VWSTNYFVHKQIETRKVMNPSNLNPWKLKFNEGLIMQVML
jgi:hypothetical protein